MNIFVLLKKKDGLSVTVAVIIGIVIAKFSESVFSILSADIVGYFYSEEAANLLLLSRSQDGVQYYILALLMAILSLVFVEMLSGVLLTISNGDKNQSKKNSKKV